MNLQKNGAQAACLSDNVERASTRHIFNSSVKLPGLMRRSSQLAQTAAAGRPRSDFFQIYSGHLLM